MQSSSKLILFLEGRRGDVVASLLRQAAAHHR